jgi:glycosyltransferase involved in cell wall biosynthesis
VKLLVRNANIKTFNQLEIDDIMPIVQNCDVQILPAVEDGFFMPLGLQMASGKPAIVSNHSGMRDMITSKEVGVVFESGNKTDLAKSILFYLEAGGDLVKMKRACHERMLAYSYGRSADELMELLIHRVH